MRIIKVCNPYCAPCAKAHLIIDQLLSRNENLCVQIIFNATTEEGDSKRAPVRHLLSLYKGAGSEDFRKALDDWYTSEIKDYVSFARRHPAPGEPDNYDEEIRKMWNWCNENKIEFTPAFFFSMATSYRLFIHHPICFSLRRQKRCSFHLLPCKHFFHSFFY